MSPAKGGDIHGLKWLGHTDQGMKACLKAEMQIPFPRERAQGAGPASRDPCGDGANRRVGWW